VLNACLGELPREISRELTPTTEVVRSELGENCVTVFLGRDYLFDRKRANRRKVPKTVRTSAEVNALGFTPASSSIDARSALAARIIMG
jgi:hypothetical protein